MNLPVIPARSASLCIADIQRLEERVARSIMEVDDLSQLEEWRAQAHALAEYLKGKELAGPMLGAQRRVEARIGQLLGETSNGKRHDLEPSHAWEGSISKSDRQRFRVLARGLERGLPDEDWRRAREPLLKLIEERYPMPRHVPTVVTNNGAVKKPAAERAREIERLAASGHRAAQIAEKIGVSEERVRLLAKSADVQLPDTAIGRRRRLDAHRILTTTINDTDASVASGLSLLEGMELPALEPDERTELLQALNRAINGLKKLKNKMETSYAGSSASAA